MAFHDHVGVDHIATQALSATRAGLVEERTHTIEAATAGISADVSLPVASCVSAAVASASHGAIAQGFGASGQMSRINDLAFVARTVAHNAHAAETAAAHGVRLATMDKSID